MNEVTAIVPHVLVYSRLLPSLIAYIMRSLRVHAAPFSDLSLSPSLSLPPSLILPPLFIFLPLFPLLLPHSFIFKKSSSSASFASSFSSSYAYSPPPSPPRLFTVDRIDNNSYIDHRLDQLPPPAGFPRPRPPAFGDAGLFLARVLSKL